MNKGIRDMQGYANRVFDLDTLYDSDSGGILNIPVPGTKGGIFGDEGLDLAMFGEDGMIFDPTDPIDYGILALAATGIGIPAAIGIKALTTGNKIRKIASKAGNVVDRTFIPREANTIGGKAKNYGRFIAAEETVGLPSTIKDVKALQKQLDEIKKQELEDRGEFIVYANKKDGGIIEGIQSFKLGKAVKQGAKKAGKQADDTKKTGAQTADAVDEGTGAGAGADAGQAGKNIFQRNPGKTVAAGIATITAGSLFFGDDDEKKKIPKTNFTYGDMLDAGKTTVEDAPDTVGEFMREILINDYGYSRNDQGGVGPLIDPDTGDTIRDKPTFGEYVKSFGKAYGQRVASDPEFAKKMLAGFSAMMMPRDGFAPLSPLGIPEFTTGYLAQDQAIEANKGATQKLLESIKGDQELKDLYVSGELAKAGVNLNQLNNEQISKLYLEIQIEEAERLGIDPKDVQIGFINDQGEFEALKKSTLASLAATDVKMLRKITGRPKPGTTPD